MSSGIGLRLHVAGALESLESRGNSLGDIWHGQKLGYGRFFVVPFKTRHVHSSMQNTLPLILSLCNIKRMRVRILRFHKQPAILSWCTTERQTTSRSDAARSDAASRVVILYFVSYINCLRMKIESRIVGILQYKHKCNFVHDFIKQNFLYTPTHKILHKIT